MSVEVYTSLDDKVRDLAAWPRSAAPSAEGCFSEAQELTHRTVNLNAAGIPVDGQTPASTLPAFAVVGGPAHSRGCATPPLS
ncbi:hypothetical protein D3C85_1727680 [compost metagenome]